MASNPRLPKIERLRIFYAELADAAAARTIEEAADLVASTLLSIEDRFSGLERGDGIEDDGRMYPARLDNRRQVPGRPDLVRLRSRAHNTYCSDGGAILIVDLRGNRGILQSRRGWKGDRTVTKDKPTPAEAFIAKVAQAHPRLRLSCDTAELAAGSTFIDIRAGDDLIVVEHRSDRGFGFPNDGAEGDLYGTPSALFVREVDQALAHLERLLGRSLAIGAGEVGQHGA